MGVVAALTKAAGDGSADTGEAAGDSGFFGEAAALILRGARPTTPVGLDARLAIGRCYQLSWSLYRSFLFFFVCFLFFPLGADWMVFEPHPVPESIMPIWGDVQANEDGSGTRLLCERLWKLTARGLCGLSGFRTIVVKSNGCWQDAAVKLQRRWPSKQ